jgi:hypothetical protein
MRVGRIRQSFYPHQVHPEPRNFETPLVRQLLQRRTVPQELRASELVALHQPQIDACGQVERNAPHFPRAFVTLHRSISRCAGRG